MSLEVRITQQVRVLEGLNLEGLRTEWRRLYGPAPKLRSVDLLRRLLAWRIQADHLGGLSPAVLAAINAKPTTAKKTRLSQGVRISREWQGRRYDVQATDDGYLFNGQSYGSLSEVARVITGVRWNGPRFFGLRSGAA